MKRRHIPALAIPAGILAALAIAIPGYTHNASISCGSDGDVHAQAGQYNDGVYVIDGGTPHPFHSGFAVTLDGGTRHTLSVTADDWAPFTDSAGPCPATTTTGATTSSSPSTSTPASSSPSSTTAPSSSAPTTTMAATSTSPTTSSAPPSTTASPPSTEWQVGPPTCDHLTPEECNATETTLSPDTAPPSSTPSPSTGPGTTPNQSSPPSSSPPSSTPKKALPVTGPSPLAPEIVGIGFLVLAAGTGAVVVARRRRP